MCSTSHCTDHDNADMPVAAFRQTIHQYNVSLSCRLNLYLQLMKKDRMVEASHLASNDNLELGAGFPPSQEIQADTCFCSYLSPCSTMHGYTCQ